MEDCEEIDIISSYAPLESAPFSLRKYLDALKIQINDLLKANQISPHEILNSPSEFYEKLPLIHYTHSTREPYVLYFSALFLAYNTQGAGRFISDSCSRWLIPGKQLPIVHVNSFVFQFANSCSQKYFIHEMLVDIGSEEDFEMALQHLPEIIQEIKMCILAVQHTRAVVVQKNLTLEQKRLVVKENFSSLMQRPSKEFDINIFDHVHHLLIKFLSEKKLSQVKDEVSKLHHHKSQVFERDIFYDMQRYFYLFKDELKAARSSHQFTRIISYMYLFRKTVQYASLSAPTQRHLSLKVLKFNQTNDSPSYVVGIVIGLNLSKDSEFFEKRHFLEALKSIVPYAKPVQNSFAMDKKEGNLVRILYVELEKKDNERFTHEEILNLRKRLPMEIKSRIETVIHPVYMPKNEEEVLKNIIILSDQLKLVQDLPQVIISFHHQNPTHLIFTVVLLRLLKAADQPVRTLLLAHKHNIYFRNFDSKIVGVLRKRYLKEANVFEAKVEKSLFMRKNYSLDLFEARKFVLETLFETLGPVRDYNGGMLSKQNENLRSLQSIMTDLHQEGDFLLRNYFYSIYPTHMQSILSPKLLKFQFGMLLKAFEHDYKKEMIYFTTNLFKQSFILAIGSLTADLKDYLFFKIEERPEFEEKVTKSSVHTYDIYVIGLIFQFSETSEYEAFLQYIYDLLKHSPIQKQLFSPSLSSFSETF